MTNLDNNEYQLNSNENQSTLGNRAGSMNVILNSIEGLDGINAHPSQQRVIDAYKVKNNNSLNIRNKSTKKSLQLLQQA